MMVDIYPSSVSVTQSNPDGRLHKSAVAHLWKTVPPFRKLRVGNGGTVSRSLSHVPRERDTGTLKRGRLVDAGLVQNRSAVPHPRVRNDGTLFHSLKRSGLGYPAWMLSPRCSGRPGLIVKLLEGRIARFERLGHMDVIVRQHEQNVPRFGILGCCSNHPKFFRTLAISFCPPDAGSHTPHPCRHSYQSRAGRRRGKPVTCRPSICRSWLPSVPPSHAPRERDRRGSLDSL